METQEQPKHPNSISKNVLYYVLIALIILMIVFSIRAIKDKGLEGYNTCVQDKCEAKGTEFCEKLREKNNCCQGAGGQLAQTDQGLTCVFN